VAELVRVGDGNPLHTEGRRRLQQPVYESLQR